jgi:hypothetical protein
MFTVRKIHNVWHVVDAEGFPVKACKSGRAQANREAERRNVTVRREAAERAALAQDAEAYYV